MCIRDSFPYSVGQEPLSYSQFTTGRPASDQANGIPEPVGDERFVSRYLDGPNGPLYPFGWGLSYTQFSYSPVTLSATQISLASANADRDRNKGLLKVGVDVKNTGFVAGTEVVQLYIRNKFASLEQPIRELKGFQRVALAPGEQKHVEFTLGFNELAFYNAKAERVMEPTQYRVFVGGSSRATEYGDVEIASR